MTHDLNEILASVLKHFEPIKRQIVLDWVDLKVVDKDVFDGHNDWGCCLRPMYGDWPVFLGLHPALQRAPLYVVKYVVFHEVLHIVLPRRGNCSHHKAFKVAERLWPDYLKAEAWLTKHYSAI